MMRPMLQFIALHTLWLISNLCTSAQIIGFTLIRTPSTELGPLADIIDLDVTGRSLSIKAEATLKSKGRIEFWFNGKKVKDEYAAPYAIGGDTGGAYNSFPPMIETGTHTVVAKTFDSKGKNLDSRTMKFTTTASKSPVAAPIFVPILVATPIVAPPTVPVPIVVQPPVPTGAIGSYQILGELRKWHKVTLAFTGPFVSETDNVNPFLQYRFDVNFLHISSGKSYKVPGFFAADGNAANTSASSGNQWHCHFAPDEIGRWSFDVSFVQGTDISVSTAVGTTTSFHGQSGFFTIEASNKIGRDHRGKGRLMYVGQHHLKFAETGEWFLKAGADSPENFLAYDDFDNTPDTGGRRKSWSPHLQHFVTGDPTWKNGKGKGIIGAVNYLSQQGMNAFSFLTMNINGDDRNVFPYITSTNRLSMDVSKLAQWEMVFEHADKMGMFLHFKTGETENDQLLDGGALGKERKLYYRELIARFGHHLALNWNLGEEITNTIAQIKQFSDFFKSTDPYKHMVVVHTYPQSLSTYTELTGYLSIDGASLQTLPANVFRNTLQWVQNSALAGHKWIVANDEQNPADTGVVPDSVDPNHDVIRQSVLWGNIMAGGSGVEYYFGYDHPENDLLCEDWASRQNMWIQSRYALEFFRNSNIPFHRMSYVPNRVNNATDWLLSSSDGLVHVIYRRSTPSSGSINMVGLPGTYMLKWFNPRAGGVLQNGSVTSIVGGTNSISYGNPPNSADKKDWVLLLQKF